MPTPTLASATRFSIDSKSTGRTYSISVFRPTGYTVPKASCPILFMLDGDLTFGTAVESAALRGMLGMVEPAIIVGVGYEADMMGMLKLRTKDLTPPTPAGAYADMAGLIGEEYGGADAFLAFLTEELAPAIRARAPEASQTRLSIFGASLGGLFVAYSLMKRPQVFESMFANSPSLWWNKFTILDLLPGFLKDIATLSSRPRVHIGVGAREQEVPTEAPAGMDLEAIQKQAQEARMVDAAREFAESLRAAHLPELKFVAFQDEDHTSVVAAAVGRAVTFALKKK